jgi:hypothetical protein
LICTHLGLSCLLVGLTLYHCVWWLILIVDLIGLRSA